MFLWVVFDILFNVVWALRRWWKYALLAYSWHYFYTDRIPEYNHPVMAIIIAGIITAGLLALFIRWDWRRLAGH